MKILTVAIMILGVFYVQPAQANIDKHLFLKYCSLSTEDFEILKNKQTIKKFHDEVEIFVNTYNKFLDSNNKNELLKKKMDELNDITQELKRINKEKKISIESLIKITNQIKKMRLDLNEILEKK